MTSAAVTLPTETGKANRSRLLSPRLLFILATLFVLLFQALYPQLRRAVGISHYEKWFLDSYAVLASSDAALAGIPPGARNPYDVFQRSHKYSDWWFVLGKLGITREHNFIVGGCWVLAFLFAVFVTLKPRTYAEAVWLCMLVGSPPVFLGIFRANNDLVIFVLLTFALVALGGNSAPRIALAISALVLATGLKFYPIVATGILLLIPVPRRRHPAVVIGALIQLVVIASIWPQIARGAFYLPPQLHTFGSRIFLIDLGFSASTGAMVSPLLIVLLSVALVQAIRMPEREPSASTNEIQMAMALGAALLVICFVAGTNYAYRFIFALWVAPWCWAHRADPTLARFGVWLLPLMLWNHGVLSMATELWFPHLRPEQYDRIITGWRFLTEPATWYLMALLGAWWLQSGWDFLRQSARKH